MDTDRRSVVHAVFAPDAKSIAVATVGGPPVVVRTPVAKYKNTDLARCAFSVSTTPRMWTCRGVADTSSPRAALWLRRSSPRPVRRRATSTRRPAAYRAARSGFRFYYLDRFVVGPDGGNVVLDAVALDSNPDRCRREARPPLF